MSSVAFGGFMVICWWTGVFVVFVVKRVRKFKIFRKKEKE
jgi:threonine aldolase